MPPDWVLGRAEKDIKKTVCVAIPSIYYNVFQKQEPREFWENTAGKCQILKI